MMILYGVIIGYVVVAILLATMLAISLVRLGGFQGMADAINNITKGNASSLTIQWDVVLIVLFWPFYIFIAVQALRKGRLK